MLIAKHHHFINDIVSYYKIVNKNQKAYSVSIIYFTMLTLIYLPYAYYMLLCVCIFLVINLNGVNS